MSDYSKPVWEMVKEAVSKLGEATTRDVIDYIKRNYPDDDVKESTIRAHMIACSVNHTSAHHYKMHTRFLFRIGKGRYRVYNPKKDGKWVVESTGARKIDLTFDGRGNLEPPFVRLTQNFQIQLPLEVREKLKLNPDDILVFITKNEEIIIKKGKLKVEIITN